MVDSREETEKPQAEQQQSSEKAHERDEHECAHAQKLSESMFHFITTFFTVLFAGLLVVSSFLTLGAIWAQVWIYNQQLEEMRKSTDAATKAAKAAETSVEQARETARLDQRAWVTVRAAILTKPLAVGGKPEVKLEMINSGKTPALETQVATAINVGSQTPIINLPTLPSPVSRSVVGPGATITTTYESPSPINAQAEIDSIQNGPNFLYASGFIIYDDVFGKHHQTEFSFKIYGKALGTLLMSSSETGNTAN